MTDSDRVEQILHHILEAIKPDQGQEYGEQHLH
jgi:hypothetical protein